MLFSQDILVNKLREEDRSVTLEGVDKLLERLLILEQDIRDLHCEDIEPSPTHQVSEFQYIVLHCYMDMVIRDNCFINFLCILD